MHAQKLDQAIVDKIEATLWAPVSVAKQEEDVQRPIHREIDYPETNHGGLQPRSAKKNFRHRGAVRCVREVCHVLGHDARRFFPAGTWSRRGVHDKDGELDARRPRNDGPAGKGSREREKEQVHCRKG